MPRYMKPLMLTMLQLIRIKQEMRQVWGNKCPLPAFYIAYYRVTDWIRPVTYILEAASRR